MTKSLTHELELDRLNLLSHKISVAKELLSLNPSVNKPLISVEYVLEHIIGITPEEIAANMSVWHTNENQTDM